MGEIHAARSMTTLPRKTVKKQAPALVEDSPTALPRQRSDRPRSSAGAARSFHATNVFSTDPSVVASTVIPLSLRAGSR